MKRVVVTEFMDTDALEAFGSEIDVLYEPSLVDDRTALLKQVANADAIIVRNRTRVDVGLLKASPKLAAVGRLGVGLENIDLEACAARQVVVLPATGANTQSVVEYVIGAVLTLRRRVFASSEEVAAGTWPRARLGKGGEIAGSMLGLVGFGGIAQAVAEVARALGMSISAYDPLLPKNDPKWLNAERCDFDELLLKSDVVSIHVPLTDGTKRMFDENALAKMKSGAILINTARGEIVDEAALVQELRAGRLGGAAIDVFAEEPLGASGTVFMECPNLILTPHIAGVTEDANNRVSQMTVAQVKSALQSGRGG